MTFLKDCRTCYLSPASTQIAAQQFLDSLARKDAHRGRGTWEQVSKYSRRGLAGCEAPRLCGVRREDARDTDKRMRTLKIVLAYDGFDFHGWQVQPGLNTIQGLLSTAMERVTGETVLPQGSGRTDAGVHALAQVASCTIASPIPVSNLAKALNHVLPPAIRVLEVTEAAPDFHARGSATAKSYRYRIFRADVCPPFLARYVYHYPYPLDEDEMFRASDRVVGTHDFTSFASVDPERGGINGEVNNVRTIFSSAWHAGDGELVYTVRGNGFLHHMVRNLVGTFILVGKGTLSGDDVERILRARSRPAAGPTAPAHGLYLVKVEY